MHKESVSIPFSFLIFIINFSFSRTGCSCNACRSTKRKCAVMEEGSRKGEQRVMEEKGKGKECEDGQKRKQSEADEEEEEEDGTWEDWATACLIKVDMVVKGLQKQLEEMVRRMEEQRRLEDKQWGWTARLLMEVKQQMD